MTQKHNFATATNYGLTNLRDSVLLGSSVIFKMLIFPEIAFLTLLIQSFSYEYFSWNMDFGKHQFL
ncbi:MAG: hypothetical protein HQM12_07710 [SAR324 cluster bacterium]|nr:hypothetical protein [SAR324 cluster bacterium]